MFRSEIRLINTEIEYVVKVIKSLEKRTILLEGNFLNESWFIFYKNVLVPIAKSLLIQLEVTAVASATYAAIQ